MEFEGKPFTAHDSGRSRKVLKARLLEQLDHSFTFIVKVFDVDEDTLASGLHGEQYRLGAPQIVIPIDRCDGVPPI